MPQRSTGSSRPSPVSGLGAETGAYFGTQLDFLGPASFGSESVLQASYLRLTAPFCKAEEVQIWV